MGPRAEIEAWSDGELRVAALNGISADLISVTLCGPAARAEAWLRSYADATRLTPPHPWHHPMYLDAPSVRDGSVFAGLPARAAAASSDVPSLAASEASAAEDDEAAESEAMDVMRKIRQLKAKATQITEQAVEREEDAMRTLGDLTDQSSRPNVKYLRQVPLDAPDIDPNALSSADHHVICQWYETTDYTLLSSSEIPETPLPRMELDSRNATASDGASGAAR